MTILVINVDRTVLNASNEHGFAKHFLYSSRLNQKPAIQQKR